MTQVLGASSSAVCTSCLKTWINSWSTSSRYHEDEIWACFFGCSEERDDLAHYIRCPIMWTLAASAVPLLSTWHPPIPPILEKLCLVKASPVSVKRLAMVYRGYDAIRMKHKRLVNHCITTDEFAQVNSLFTKLCRDIWIQS